MNVHLQVEHLTDEDFKPFLKKKKHALVMFYTPWCPHCKAAKPEYMEVGVGLTAIHFNSYVEQNCSLDS